RGFRFACMVLSEAVVGVIERRWVAAAAWCAVAAFLSVAGLMHSCQWTLDDTVLKLSPAWPYAIGYGAMSILFFTAKWTTEESGEDGGLVSCRSAPASFSSPCTGSSSGSVGRASPRR